MRMLVLGAGLQGSACAYDLLQNKSVERVTVADLKPDRALTLLKSYVGSRLALVKLDVHDGAAVRDIVFQQKKLDPEARAKGVTVIPDCGLAPGMVNILAAEGIRRVADAETVKIFVGGLPQHPEPPLNYQIVYSLEGALD